MFDPVGFASDAFLLTVSAGCAFDASFDSTFDVCGQASEGGRGGGPLRVFRPRTPSPEEDPDELLALI